MVASSKELREELRNRQIAHIGSKYNLPLFRQAYGHEQVSEYFGQHWDRYERVNGRASLYLTICGDCGITPQKGCLKTNGN